MTYQILWRPFRAIATCREFVPKSPQLRWIDFGIACNGFVKQLNKVSPVTQLHTARLDGHASRGYRPRYRVPRSPPWPALLLLAVAPFGAGCAEKVVRPRSAPSRHRTGRAPAAAPSSSRPSPTRRPRSKNTTPLSPARTHPPRPRPEGKPDTVGGPRPRPPPRRRSRRRQASHARRRRVSGGRRQQMARATQTLAQSTTRDSRTT
jgi:hypothetical protein